MAFKRAEKAQSKLRLALFGPAGSGKTYTALAIAHGLLAIKQDAKISINGRIGVGDSERGSASKYAGRQDKDSGVNFEFDTSEFDESKKMEDYIQMIREAKEQKVDVLIIDSMTHAWDELLEEIDKIAKTRFKGNSWAAWQEGTPKQRKFIDAILSYPGHVIATMRSKTEWQTETDIESGKLRPRRIGTKPEQGKNIEYEFDMLIDMDERHWGTVLKDRTGKFQDEILEKPGVRFGMALASWLADGKEVLVPVKKKEEEEKTDIQPTPSSNNSSVKIPAAKASEEQVKELNREAKRLGITPKEIEERLGAFGVKTFKDLKRSDASDILEQLNKMKKK